MQQRNYCKNLQRNEEITIKIFNAMKKIDL